MKSVVNVDCALADKSNILLPATEIERLFRSLLAASRRDVSVESAAREIRDGGEMEGFSILERLEGIFAATKSFPPLHGEAAEPKRTLGLR